MYVGVDAIDVSACVIRVNQFPLLITHTFINLYILFLVYILVSFVILVIFGFGF